MVSGLKRFSQSDIASERLRIIKFYNTHGEKTTKDAFGVGKKVIFVWKKKLSFARGRLTSLIPISTRPHTSRSMETDPKVFKFIKSLREKYPRLGKEKIYPLLVAFCTKEGIKPIKISTICKVIKRNNLFYQRQGNVYHNLNLYSRKKTKRLRVRYAPKHKDLGHLQMDTILRYENGIKYYFYTVIDTKGKFAFCLPYKTLTSTNTLDFYSKAVSVIPYNVKSVQTDNGLEFLGVFSLYLQNINIPHFFTYPRCPKINGVIERFNRSVQEEFIDFNLHHIHDQKTFTSNLADYLLFYNYQRVHQALGDTSPMAYLLQKGVMSKNSVTYTTTCMSTFLVLR